MNDYYLFGFFKNMNSGNKVGALAILAFTSVCFVGIFLMWNHNVKLIETMSTTADCTSKILLGDYGTETTRKLIYACKGISIKLTCEERVLSDYNMINRSKEKLTLMMNLCRNGKLEKNNE